MKVIGMISGTSYDGIDVACCEFTQVDDVIEVKQVGFSSLEYSDELHQLIAESMPPRSIDMERVCVLDTLIGQAFSRAAQKAIAENSFEPDLIVSHGQTLFHWIDANHKAKGTLQLGEAAWIAEETGVQVLSNIRSRDVAAGGHGAPLVSVLDQLLLGHSESPEGALNLGGISNITIAGKSVLPIAYDIGPANGLLDAAIFAHSQGRVSFDEDGKVAGAGKIDTELLNSFLAEPYYALPAPKTTGKELFHLPYLISHAGPVDSWSIENLMATLLELTVETVAREVERNSLTKLFIAGGGSANPVMMNRLQERLTKCKVLSISELGIDPRAKESITFALIGYLTLHGLPGQIPSCTGASGERLLGSLTPGTGPLVIPAPLDVKPARIKVVN
ncbi:MAG: anhydro-N-acetylmuramic acid kinase [Candidatus Nanopelagicaceae bacterium]|nr:anhydro-N-acetylmuramic acid kinase [Candidatus Nanopelagicaceae bacterium]